MSSWTVVAAPVPDSLESPEAWALHGAARVTYARQTASWGYPDLMHPAWYLIGHLQEQTYARRIVLVAVPEGTQTPTPDDVAGIAELTMPLTDNTHSAEIELTVDPARTRAGVGSALLAEVERIATEAGRTSLMAWSEHVGEPEAGSPNTIEAPTGSGRIRTDDGGAAFAQKHGYTLEQAERYSLLRLPVEEGLLDRLSAEAAATAGPDYRVHVWRDHIPDEWLDQLAVLESRMSTDAPNADLDFQQTAWDADRVRAWEKQTEVSGHGMLVAAAEHVPSTTLAAFTVLSFPMGYEEIVFQGDTLVLPEFRGHRLGMLVKTANLVALREARPGAARVHTWNAEENRFMLAINVALGFRPTGVCGAWQKRLG